MSALIEITDRLAAAALVLADSEDVETCIDASQDEVDTAVEDVRQALRDLAHYRAQQAGQTELPL